MKADNQNQVSEFIPTHDQITKVTEEEFAEKGTSILRAARLDKQQVAIVDGDNNITAVVGLNGVRSLPEIEEDEELAEWVKATFAECHRDP